METFHYLHRSSEKWMWDVTFKQTCKISKNCLYWHWVLYYIVLYLYYRDPFAHPQLKKGSPNWLILPFILTHIVHFLLMISWTSSSSKHSQFITNFTILPFLLLSTRRHFSHVGILPLLDHIHWMFLTQQQHNGGYLHHGSVKSTV